MNMFLVKNSHKNNVKTIMTYYKIKHIIDIRKHAFIF